MQDAESRVGCDQEPSAEQSHQGVRLALKAWGESNSTDLHVMCLLRQHRLDAGINVLQVGLLAARELLSGHELRNELQPSGPGEGSAAGLQQDQMVISRVATIEVPGVA